MSDRYGVGLATQKAREWVAERDRRVLAAHRDGVPLREIAADAEMSYGGIWRIVNRKVEA